MVGRVGLTGRWRGALALTAAGVAALVVVGGVRVGRPRPATRSTLAAVVERRRAAELEVAVREAGKRLNATSKALNTQLARSDAELLDDGLWWRTMPREGCRSHRVTGELICANPVRALPSDALSDGHVCQLPPSDVPGL